MVIIPNEIQYIINRLEQKGFEAYIVGGCVRDMLLGLTPFDFDVTTSAKPKEIISLFEKTVPTGIKHGTVTVIVDGTSVEATTFRSEHSYFDSRHPESVSFISSINEDLARRDFTVNAIAYNNATGLVDCFGGENDLKNRILRAVGNPKERFKEDALRILRLFRFAATLDFKIERQTLSAALELSDGLKQISRERISAELKKAVCGKNLNALKPLIEIGGLSFLGINRTADFSALKSLDNPPLSLFAFLYLSCNNIKATLNELKASNQTKSYCNTLLNLLSSKKAETKADVKNLLAISNEDIFKDFLIFKSNILTETTAKQEKFLEEIVNNNEPYLISHLAINGNDLKELGIEGKKSGETLEALRIAVIKNPMCNNKEALLSLIK